MNGIEKGGREMAAKSRIKALKLGAAEEFLIFKRRLLNVGQVVAVRCPTLRALEAIAMIAE